MDTHTTSAPSPPVPSDGFEMLRRRAAFGISSCVHEFIHYRETVPGLFRQVETASLVVPLVISFGTPFAIGLGRDPGSDETYGSFASGLFPGQVVIHSTGFSDCIQVNFTPLGAWRFFGLPMSELAARMVTLDDLAGRDIRELRLRLADQADPVRRVDLVESFVTGRLLCSAAYDPVSEAAYALLLRQNGDVRISRLAARLDLSRKHLAERFRAAIGVPPKTVARIMRFNRAQQLARAGEDWADIAASCGYADQAHLAREFQEMSGSTPTAWKAAA